VWYAGKQCPEGGSEDVERQFENLVVRAGDRKENISMLSVEGRKFVSMLKRGIEQTYAGGREKKVNGGIM